MNKPRLIILAAMAAVAAASVQAPAQQRERRLRDRDAAPLTTQPAASDPQPQPSRQGYGARYAVLEQRNIFVRDRSRPTTRAGSLPSTQPVRRSAEQSLVLRGIAMEELGYRAYVEDLNTHETLRVSPGDPLARGTVASVALDAIAYEHDGRQIWIDIGSDLTGAIVAPIVASTTAPSSPDSPAPATLPANVDPNDPSLTVEQRMRLRVQLQQQRRRQ